MQLKEDYKDPIYEGSKTYRIIQNADGSSGILDTTKYTQEGIGLRQWTSTPQTLPSIR